MANNGILSFGFGQDDDNIGRRITKFKMRDGETSRVSFGWWPKNEKGQPDFTASTPKFIGAPSHYVPGVGRVIDPDGGLTEIVGSPPKLRILTVLVRWPTNPMTGALDAERLKAGHWSVELWDFTKTKYAQLRPLHDEWNFAEHDLKCTCTDAGFQAMTFVNCKENLLRKLEGKETFEDIMSAVDALASQASGELGRVMSAQDLRDKITQNGADGGGGSSRSSAPPQQRPPAAASRVDDMIDGFLGEI